MKLFSLSKRYKAITIGLGILILSISEAEAARALPQPELNSSGSTELTSMESEIYTIIQQARDSWVNRDANAFASLFRRFPPNNIPTKQDG